MYARLMANRCSDGLDRHVFFDRHVFACILTVGLRDAPMPLTDAIGLTRADLADLIGSHCPDCPDLLDGLPDDRGADAWEEPDLRDLLLAHGTAGRPEERWLAAMVARRSLRPNHLWQDLGLTSREDLSGLLNRHFHPLAVKNGRNMKWKKFFYRQMCEAEEIMVCKSPICDLCPDFSVCFGPET